MTRLRPSTALSRRLFLAAGTASLASPFLARPAIAADLDCVVVGAGASGLAAARSLQGAGLRIAVLEARDRIGGRAWTDEAPLGLPFDQGAQWLHAAEANPFMAVAETLGRTTHPSPLEDMRVLRGGRPVADGPARLEEGASDLEWALGWRMLLRGDFAVGAVPASDEWMEVAARFLSFTMATDPDALSVDDVAAFADGEDRMVEGGLGRLVADYGAQVPVRLGAAVDRVAWDEGGGVTVSGPFGAVSARAAIVTIPTGVLRDGRVRFEPELPPATRAAIEALPMGRFAKIGLRLAAPLEGQPEYAFDIERALRGEAVGLHLHPRLPLATAIVAGAHADAVARMGPREREAMAVEALREALDVAPEVIASAHYDWSSDPFALGAYSVQAIGPGDPRSDYAEPVGERLFLAGDAARTAHPISVGGAHESGTLAAARVAALLRG